VNLSKSQYIRGLQCPKSLWLYQHRRELMSEPDAQTQNRFDTGNEVGEVAKDLFPGGVEIVHDRDNYQGMIEQTTRLIGEGAAVIYEASFREKGVFIMADILVRNGDVWDVYEVKSSTSVKPYHENDAAIQWYVLNHQIPLGRIHIVHIDNSYVFTGELDVERLFGIVDIASIVLERQAEIGANLETMKTMLDLDEPDIPIGPQCTNPFDCDFRAFCWNSVPKPSVLDLYRLSGERKFELFHQGLVNYEDLKNLPLNATQSLQVKTGMSREPHVDKYRIGEFLAGATYPINFLDFETFNSAIPKYEGQRPYMQIPFQYSLHILHEDGLLEHKEFLAKEHQDPRPLFVEKLVEDVTVTGTIVAYNQSFEKMIIRGLADEFRELENVLLDMTIRFIDLIVPFRGLMYYHPNFNGSFKLKSVLPAMFPEDEKASYKDLDIQDGEMAMASYARLDRTDNIEEKKRIKGALLAYCELDTLAMVKIWQKLVETAS